MSFKAVSKIGGKASRVLENIWLQLKWFVVDQHPLHHKTNILTIALPHLSINSEITNEIKTIALMVICTILIQGGAK